MTLKILYRYSKNLKQKEVDELALLGVSTEPGFQTIIIDEDKDNGILIKELFERWDISPIAELKPNQEELDNAIHLLITVKKVQGFPQPENTEESETPYLKGVFTLDKFNPSFGAPKGEQIGSIRLKKEPVMGRSDFMQIHWLHDLVLIKRSTYKMLYQSLGIRSIPVVDQRSGREYESVVQLKSQGLSDSNLDLTGDRIVNDVFFERNTGLKRYQLTGEAMPCFENDPGDYDFFQSREYFGGDGSASNKLMIVSQKFFRIYKENKLKGLNFYPLPPCSG